MGVCDVSISTDISAGNSIKLYERIFWIELFSWYAVGAISKELVQNCELCKNQTIPENLPDGVSNGIISSNLMILHYMFNFKNLACRHLIFG